MQRLVICGGGNMGFAIASLCTSKLPNLKIQVIEQREERRTEIKSKLNVDVLTEIPNVSNAALLFAIKPQDFTTLKLQGTKPELVISIMAGITTEKIVNILGDSTPVIRCMPNTPLQIGEGMTVYFANKNVTEEQRSFAENILSAAGKTLQVFDEGMLDAATAVSGSGPAYLYHFMESYIAAAKEIGFSEQDAELLVTQTIKGAYSLWEAGDVSIAELRRRVTSKGGTTEAALNEFNRLGAATTLSSGIKQALKRSKELG